MTTNNTPKRALIVIDVQNEYFTGGLPIEYPDPQQTVANIGVAMDAAREAGIPVIVVQQTSPASSPLFAIDTDGWQLHPVVASRPHDHYLRKLLPSAYPETVLAQWLEARGIDTLTVVGYMTHNCDASTINHALHNGTAVEFDVELAWPSNAPGPLPLFLTQWNHRSWGLQAVQRGYMLVSRRGPSLLSLRSIPIRRLSLRC